MIRERLQDGQCVVDLVRIANFGEATTEHMVYLTEPSMGTGFVSLLTLS